MTIRVILLSAVIACTQATVVGSDCIGYWDFNAVRDGQVADLSPEVGSAGKPHPGIVHGTPQTVKGIAGRALRFQTNGDYVDFGAPIIPAGDFTVSVWLNCDDVEKQFFLGQYAYRHPQRFDLAIREGRVRIQVGQIVDSPKIIEQGRWHHLVYSRDGNTLQIHVDGALIHTAILPGRVLQSENLVSGKIFVPDRSSFRFTGAIDELRIYRTALRGGEIEELATLPPPKIVLP